MAIVQLIHLRQFRQICSLTRDPVVDSTEYEKKHKDVLILTW